MTESFNNQHCLLKNEYQFLVQFLSVKAKLLKLGYLNNSDPLAPFFFQYKNQHKLQVNGGYYKFESVMK